MKRALIVVDLQNDFAEGGALGVDGGRKVAESVTTLLSTRRDDYALIVATRDWHDPDSDNGGHFAQEPDFLDTWPTHCVRGTDGAEYIDEFDMSLVDAHFVKGMGTPSYSGFEAVSCENPGVLLDRYLGEQNIGEADVVGLAADYCVKATALDAAAQGYRSRVLTDLTAAVHPDGWGDLVTELETGGVQVVEESDSSAKDGVVRS